MSEKGMRVEDLSARAGDFQIFRSLTLPMPSGEILAVIGPAGSGKTTFLRTLNRMTDLEPGLQIQGKVSLNGRSIHDDTDVVELRRKVGIVFSVPTPLPMSIYENLSFGPRLDGMNDAKILSERAERTLRAAYLWDEVKDRLRTPGTNLSGGQQQRLCLARTLMLEPDVLLLDEPCSGLDPISTAKIEEALTSLKKNMAIVLVTNNVKQASRVSDKTAFMLMGEQVEFAPTQDLFTNPRDKRTEAYVTGRFG